MASLAAIAAGCARAPAASVVSPASERVDAVVLSNPDVRFDGSLRIAAIFPSAGRYARSGIQSANGVRLAVEDVNRRGGVAGRKLKLLDYQTGSYFVDARQAAERAVGEGGALAIVGANASSLSMSIAEVAEARHVVQVSNISTAEDLTWEPLRGREREFVFRVCGSDTVMGAMLADFAARQLRARRVAVLYEVGGAYSSRLAQSFLKAYHADGRERVAAKFVYLAREVDFRPQLRAIKAYGPDLLFLPGFFAEATLVARQAADLGLKTPLLGGDGWSSKVLFKQGRPAGFAYYADLCSPPESFRQRYLSAYGAEAEGCRAVLAYDAVLALTRAMEAAGPLSDAALTTGLEQTRGRLRAALARVDFVGRTGRIRFDRHRTRDGGMAIMELTCDSERCAPSVLRVSHAG